MGQRYPSSFNKPSSTCTASSSPVSSKKIKQRMLHVGRQTSHFAYQVCMGHPRDYASLARVLQHCHGLFLPPFALCIHCINRHAILEHKTYFIKRTPPHANVHTTWLYFVHQLLKESVDIFHFSLFLLCFYILPLLCLPPKIHSHSPLHYLFFFLLVAPASFLQLNEPTMSALSNTWRSAINQSHNTLLLLMKDSKRVATTDGEPSLHRAIPHVNMPGDLLPPAVRELATLTLGIDFDADHSIRMTALQYSVVCYSLALETGAAEKKFSIVETLLKVR